VQLGPILVQLQPSLALQTLDYLKAVRDFDAAAGVTCSSKVVPLKQVRQQAILLLLQCARVFLSCVVYSTVLHASAWQLLCMYTCLHSYSSLS
jgi:hypothetical protein